MKKLKRLGLFLGLVSVAAVGPCIPELLTNDLDFNKNYVAIKDSTITKASITVGELYDGACGGKVGTSCEATPNPDDCACWRDQIEMQVVSNGKYDVNKWSDWVIAVLDKTAGSLPTVAEFYDNGIKVSATKFCGALSDGTGEGVSLKVCGEVGEGDEIVASAMQWAQGEGFILSQYPEFCQGVGANKHCSTTYELRKP